MSSDDQEAATAVHGLLRDYDRLLLVADNIRPLVWIRTRPPRGDPVDLWQIPRFSVLLRFFVRSHVRRGVEGLHRRLSAERALGRSRVSAAQEEATRLYIEAIPPPTVAR